jgi:hypothetical protein
MTHPLPPNSDTELREKLAAIEHERWVHWQKYMHSRLHKTHDGMLMSPLDYQKWEELIAAEYNELTETEKQSDREQVDRYWPLILADREAVVAEARLDELDRVFGLHNLNDYAEDHYYPRRRTELTKPRGGDNE